MLFLSFNLDTVLILLLIFIKISCWFGCFTHFICIIASLMVFLKFCFEIIVHSHEVINIDISSNLHPHSSHSNIFTYLYVRKLILIPFSNFIHILQDFTPVQHLHVCVFSSMQMYYISTFMRLPSQSKYKTVPLQGSFMLFCYRHAHLPQSPLP